MALKRLIERDQFRDDKTQKLYEHFQNLLNELDKHELPSEVVDTINTYVDELNAIESEDKALKNQLTKKKTQLYKLVEKKLKVVPKHYYRNFWMIIGMSAFGIPVGVSFGMSLGNMGYLGIGLPFGMAIGLAIGAGMDNKAAKEGRQLNIEL